MATGQTVTTGRQGTVVVGGVRVARVTNWSVNPTAGETAWGDSDGAGYTLRKHGRLDCTGTFEGKMDNVLQIYNHFIAGAAVGLSLYEGEANLNWRFPSAVITGMSITVDVDTQEPNGWSCDFANDGIFFTPAQSLNPTIGTASPAAAAQSPTESVPDGAAA